MQEPDQTPPATDATGASPLRRWLLPVLVTAAASLLLFWRLADRALWQDEAACAVMSERLLETGKPLAYDGRNLITMDEFQPEEASGLAQRTGDPRAAVDYYVAKGDFKEDTAWIGQPWGQFVWTAGSFALFGKGTFQARLPFALAGVLTALVLFVFARRRTGSSWVALAAVVLLLGSTYWVLHVRQCRYYATSSLFLLLTVVTYFRWQDAPRSLARSALFVLSAWAYFHNDFGSFWPVMGVLTFDALIAALREDRSLLPRVLATLAVIGVLVLPFAFYYELFVFEDGRLGSGRLKQPSTPMTSRLGMLLVYLNQFQLPFVFAPLVLLTAFLRGRRASPGARVALVSLAIVAAQTAWMTAVSPFPFYRYLVDMTPLSSLLVAWASVGVARALLPRAAVIPASAALVLLVLLTPWPSAVGRLAIHVPELIAHVEPPTGRLLRHELGVLKMDLGQEFPDPNGELVAFLEEHLRPQDEIVINYEDAPLMFYLDNKIRGGIGCFRVEDTPPPRFLVLRQSVGFTHAAVYRRLLASRRWQRAEVSAPDVTWGNNPDPWCHYSRQVDEVGKWDGVEVFVDAGPRDGG